jgi:acyl carrier protein
MTTQIAEHISAIIRDRFQIPADDELFTLDSHLFEEGYVDSAGVVELIAKLEQTYAIKLPDDILFSEEFTTVGGIAQIVSRLQAEAAPQVEDVSPRPMLVELAHGEGTPFFFLYGLYIYKPLAEVLSAHGPVYGVYLPAEAEAEETAKLTGKAPQLPSVQESAAAYIEVIRKQQPHGPYRLAGMSYGGIIAFEVGRQLRTNGEEVELVALLDSVLPGSLTLAPGRWVAQHLREFVRKGPQYAQGRLRRKLAKLGVGAVRMEAPANDGARAVNPRREAMYTRAIENYERTMGAYAGRVALYRADHGKEFSGYEQANDLGWGRCASALEVVDVTGNHVTILQSPMVAADLCSRIAPRILDRVSGI